MLAYLFVIGLFAVLVYSELASFANLRQPASAYPRSSVCYRPYYPVIGYKKRC